MNTAQTLVRAIGKAPLWHGVEMCLMFGNIIERFQPDSVFVNPKLNLKYSPDKMFERVMELSLTHKIVEIGVEIMNGGMKAPSMDYGDVVSIKLCLVPLEKGESETNMTPEFVETIYEKLKGPWEL